MKRAILYAVGLIAAYYTGYVRGFDRALNLDADTYREIREEAL